MRLLIPLFSPPSGAWGSLTRVLAVADAAVKSGHEVAFTATDPWRVQLERMGHRVYPAPRGKLFGLPRQISDLIAKRLPRMSVPARSGKSLGSVWMVLMAAGAARVGHLRALVRAELDAVDDFRPGALFTELDPAAFVVARVRELPIATTYATPMEAGEMTLPWRLMRRALRRVLRDHGLPPSDPHELYFSSDVLKVVPSIPELEDVDGSRRDVAFVGSLLAPVGEGSPDTLDLDPAARNVFTYMGTGSISQDVVDEVLPQVFPEGGDTRCFVGAQAISQSYVRGSVEFAPYVPAHLLLPLCDFTITHGGHNTMIQSILNGVPLIIFPGPIFERRYNARKAVEAGCAVMGERGDFTVGWLRTALDRREELVPGTARLAAQIAALGGAEGTVRAIEDFAG